MRIHILLLAGLLALAVTLPLTVAAPATAQQKFENKDTAANRQDSTWGTRKTDEDAGGYHGAAENGDASWGNKVVPKEKDNPADDVIIVVNPDVKYGTQTTTTTNKDAAGNVTGSTTTTTEN